MIFTSEDLIKAMGLVVGDKLKINFKQPNIVWGTVEKEIVFDVVYDENNQVVLANEGELFNVLKKAFDKEVKE